MNLIFPMIYSVIAKGPASVAARPRTVSNSNHPLIESSDEPPRKRRLIGNAFNRFVLLTIKELAN